MLRHLRFDIMKLHFLAALLTAAASLPATSATIPLYQNNGTKLNEQIDALAILNNGTLNYSTTLPFAPKSTLYITNSSGGLFNGNVGFWFGTPPQPVVNVVNRGRIQGTANLLINTSTLTNSGRLAVAPQGLLQLRGNNINLSHGAVTSGGGSAPTTSDGFSSGDFYLNPSSITDLYWGAGTNDVFSPPGGNVSMLLSSFASINPTTPTHEVVREGIAFTNRIRLPNLPGSPRTYEAHAYTNSVGGENIVQIVLTPVDTNVTTTVRFSPSGGLERTAIVEFAAPDVDIVTGLPFTNFLYLVDNFAVSGPASAVLQTNSNNGFIVPDHFKPAPYELFRTVPFQWLSSVAPTFPNITNTTEINNLLIAPYLSNRVGNQYIAWSAQIGKPLTFIGGTALTDPTNAGGRVEIAANNLDLSSASVRAETYLSIKATNLINNSNAVLEAPFIDFQFVTTNQQLKIDSFVNPTVKRLSGTVNAWSALWTNRTVAVPLAPFQFHALVIDHRLVNFQAVSLGTFSGKGTNLILASPLTAVRSFTVDAPRITFATNSLIRLDLDVATTQLPSAQYVTNFGSLFISQNLIFGSDTPQPYSNFLNAGLIDAGSLSIRSKTLSIGGTMITRGGAILLDGTSAEITNATITSAADLQINAASLVVTNTSITAAGSLVISATNSLTDNNTTNNQWQTASGFQFLTKPTTGDLLGTTIRVQAPNFPPAINTAAGQDRGRTLAGFSNNAAIGHLILDGAAGAFFSFGGLAQTNALYVDYLELLNEATNYLTSLDIATNLIIYFADANLPANKLDNALNGRLRWVRNYAGIFSGTNVTLPPRPGEAVGQTLFVNRSLLASSAVDSDADGDPNDIDLSPFDGVMISQSMSPTNILLQWTGAAETVYQIECSTNLMGTNGMWMSLAYVTNSAPTNFPMLFSDTLSHSNCVYRINYNPSGQFP